MSEIRDITTTICRLSKQICLLGFCVSNQDLLCYQVVSRKI